MIGPGIFGSAFLSDCVNIRSEANKKIFDDQVFSLAKRFTVAKSTSVDIVFDPTAHSGVMCFLPIAFTCALGGPIEIDLHLGVDANENGKPWTTINRNNPSIVTANLKIRLNPTIVDAGIIGPEFLIPSDGTGAVAKAGGQAQEDLAFNANTAIKYMFRVRNIDAVTDVKMSIGASWFELPSFP